MSATNSLQCALAACLVSSHLWANALSLLSVTAQLVATITGAIIGVVTLYRMWKGHHPHNDKPH